MKMLFLMLGHLVVTLARLASPGGLRSVVAESLAVKHQLLIMRRSQRRAPQSDLVGSANAWILYAFGLAEARPQNVRNNQAFDFAAFSPCFGEVQISSSV